MYKGYEIRKGDKAEAFKKYLRTRNFYFEPSENGNFVHFEVENPDEYVDGYIENMKKAGIDSTQYVYEFPDGTTLQDINMARRLGLTYLGKAKYRSGAYGYFIQGTLPELQFYAEEYIGGYELHPDYLCPAKEFAGLDELKEAGYFEDGKYCGKDKKVRLQGSKKIKDGSNDSRIIAEAQKQIDIQENRIYDCYDDDGNWKKPYSKMEQIEADADDKASALCYLIKAYGGIPEYCPGINGGIPMGYDGPVNARPPKDYPVSLKNNSTVIKMCQQEIDRLIEEELSLLYDEEGNGAWKTLKGFKAQEIIDEKVTALCYVIKAFGGVPVIGAGWDGLAMDYDGPRKS